MSEHSILVAKPAAMFNPSPQQTLKRYEFFLTVFIGDQQALSKAIMYQDHGTQRTTPEQGIVGPLWKSQLGTSMEGVVDGLEVTYLLKPSMVRYTCKVGDLNTVREGS